MRLPLRKQLDQANEKGQEIGQQLEAALRHLGFIEFDARAEGFGFRPFGDDRTLRQWIEQLTEKEQKERRLPLREQLNQANERNRRLEEKVALARRCLRFFHRRYRQLFDSMLTGRDLMFEQRIRQLIDEEEQREGTFCKLELAFLAAIHANPRDDTTRLIYADWLEERGDPLGEMIRVSCAEMQLDSNDPQQSALHARGEELVQQHGEAWVETGSLPAQVSHSGRYYKGLPTINVLLDLACRWDPARCLDDSLWTASPRHMLGLTLTACPLPATPLNRGVCWLNIQQIMAHPIIGRISHIGIAFRAYKNSSHLRVREAQAIISAVAERIDPVRTPSVFIFHTYPSIRQHAQQAFGERFILKFID